MRYLHLHAPSPRRLDDLIDRAKAHGLVTADRAACGWLGFSASSPPPLTRYRDLIVVGQWFGNAPMAPPAQPRDLIERGWGRYIAMTRDDTGRIASVLRDPSGALEAAIWTADDVQIVADAAPDWLWSRLPGPVRLDLSGVATLLSDPLACLSAPGLTGIAVLDAGEVLDTRTGQRQLAWNPVDWVGRARRRSAAARGRRLVRLVDDCVRTLHPDGAAVAELSGGLDSAIVASALCRAERPPSHAITVWAEAPGADERRWAGLAADHVGVDLREVARPLRPPAAGDLMALGGDLRPALGRADAGFDAAIADVLTDLGASTLFTGKGGDALFHQGWGPEVLADHLGRRPVTGWISRLPWRLARLTRRSIFDLSRAARSGGPSPSPPFGNSSGASTPSAPVHPWLRDEDGLSLAERLRLRALVSNLAYVTESRRGSVADVIHPLMSQPLLEWALATPVSVLMDGTCDRSLARDAFSARLSPRTLARQSKGDHSIVQSRELSAALPLFRTHLLDGTLRALGLIDAAAVEEQLDRDRLAWQGGSAAVMRLVMVESWVRRWSGRQGPASRRPV
ncbi:asparagine synthase-related protein [Brevundimonas lutea]|uniref:asparagine synthase-related protein n=1 Tax=Brevundimonas lutea TaxID=2293980 RepID=UPI000F021809|nr:asparagine synthase C-terminal domain-containing protein [Brevundimonas lutea]